MVVPPARPIETTSSDDSTSESSVRRVRAGTLAPPARFYTPCSAPKPHLDDARATLQPSGGKDDVCLGAAIRGRSVGGRRGGGVRGEDGGDRPSGRIAPGGLPVPDRRLVSRDSLSDSLRDSAGQRIPLFHSLAALLSKIRDFQSHAVGIREEQSVVVDCVFGEESRGADFDAGGGERGGDAIDVPLALDAQANVMQAGRVGIVASGALVGGAQDQAEEAVEILPVALSAEGKAALSEAQNGRKNLIVELLRALERTHREVEVIDTDDLSFHGSSVALTAMGL